MDNSTEFYAFPKIKTSQVNLIVGRNNIGKTTFLESLRRQPESRSLDITPSDEEHTEIVEFLNDCRLCDVYTKFCDKDELVRGRDLGKGMLHVFHTLLAIIKAKHSDNKVLIFDDIEMSLHYAVLYKLWRYLFEVAKNHNIQIFASTHSQDAIVGFSKAWSDYPELGSFHRLSKRKNGLEFVRYDCETLQYAVKGNIEVR